MEKPSIDKELLTTQFKVIIPNCRGVRFTSCQGIESEVDVEYLQAPGEVTAPKTSRGKHVSSRITFTRGIVSDDRSSNESIVSWFVDICNSGKKLDKRTLSVVVTDESDKKICEWQIINAWPCRYVGPLLHSATNDFQVEMVSFAHEGIELR